MIFERAPNEPCCFEVIDDGNMAFVPNIFRVPLILQINYALRDISLKNYQKLPMTKGFTYFDHNVDVICFGYGCSYKANTIKWLVENICAWYLEFRLSS